MFNIKKLILFFSIISITIITLSPNILAWDDCPFGFENEKYPGSCSRYIDTNNDGICDHSQSKPTNQEVIDQESNSNVGNQIQNQSSESRFLVVVILSFIIVLIFIIISKLMKKAGLLSNLKEKIIWNILLLIFFLPSGITGIILVLMPSFPALREIGFNFIQLHNVTSFFFLWISGYHILWHLAYYKKCIKKLAQ